MYQSVAPIYEWPSQPFVLYLPPPFSHFQPFLSLIVICASLLTPEISANASTVIYPSYRETFYITSLPSDRHNQKVGGELVFFLPRHSLWVDIYNKRVKAHINISVMVRKSVQWGINDKEIHVIVAMDFTNRPSACPPGSHHEGLTPSAGWRGCPPRIWTPLTCPGCRASPGRVRARPPS